MLRRKEKAIGTFNAQNGGEKRNTELHTGKLMGDEGSMHAMVDMAWLDLVDMTLPYSYYFCADFEHF